MASTAAAAPPPPKIPPPPASGIRGLPSKVYNGLVNSVDKHVPAKLRPLWVHPAGMKFIITLMCHLIGYFS